MSPPRYGTYTQTVTLPQGGTISLNLTDVNPINLDADQRAWLCELVDLFHQYDPGPEPEAGRVRWLSWFRSTTLNRST